MSSNFRGMSRRKQRFSGRLSRLSGIFRVNSTSSNSSDQSLELNPIRNSSFHNIKPSYMSESETDTSSFYDGCEDDIFSIAEELQQYSQKQQRSEKDGSPAKSDQIVKEQRETQTLNNHYVVIVKNSVAVHLFFFVLSLLMCSSLYWFPWVSTH